MRSVRLQEAYEFAKKYDSKLKATDKRFKKTVVAVLDDGAVFVIPSAFSMKFKKYKEFTFILSEHYEIVSLENDSLTSITG